MRWSPHREARLLLPGAYVFLIRFILRSLVVIVWILAGLLIELLVFHILSRRARQWTIRIWSRVLLRMCGVQVHRHGRPILKGAVLWVAHHVSWNDIFVLNTLRRSEEHTSE